MGVRCRDVAEHPTVFSRLDPLGNSTLTYFFARLTRFYVKGRLAELGARVWPNFLFGLKSRVISHGPLVSLLFIIINLWEAVAVKKGSFVVADKLAVLRCLMKRKC